MLHNMFLAKQYRFKGAIFVRQKNKPIAMLEITIKFILDVVFVICIIGLSIRVGTVIGEWIKKLK